MVPNYHLTPFLFNFSKERSNYALRKTFLSLFSTFPQADMYFIINEVCDKLASTINEHISDLLNDELVSNELFNVRNDFWDCLLNGSTKLQPAYCAHIKLG